MNDNTQENKIKLWPIIDKIISYLGLIGLTGYSLRDLIPSFYYNISVLFVFFFCIWAIVTINKYINIIYDKNKQMNDYIEKIKSDPSISVSCSNDCKKILSTKLDETVTNISTQFGNIHESLLKLDNKIINDNEQVILHFLSDKKTLLIISISQIKRDYTLEITGPSVSQISYNSQFEPRNENYSSIVFFRNNSLSSTNQDIEDFLISAFPGVSIGILTFNVTKSSKKANNYEIKVKQDDIEIKSTKFSI